MGKLLELFVYVASSLGLFVSIILAILGIASFSSPLTGLSASVAKSAMFGLFPVGAAFIYRKEQLTYDLTQREIDNSFYSGCPEWMRSIAYFLMLAGIILFFLPGVFEIFGYIQKSDGSFFPSTTPGGFGMVAYTTFIAQLYSAKITANTSLERTLRDKAAQRQ